MTTTTNNNDNNDDGIRIKLYSPRHDDNRDLPEEKKPEPQPPKCCCPIKITKELPKKKIGKKRQNKARMQQFREANSSRFFGRAANGYHITCPIHGRIS